MTTKRTSFAAMLGASLALCAMTASAMPERATKRSNGGRAGRRPKAEVSSGVRRAPAKAVARADREKAAEQTVEINGRNKALVVLNIDRSRSTGDEIVKGGKRKIDVIRDAVGCFLADMTEACGKGSGPDGDEEFNDYFDVAVLGFGEDTDPASSTYGQTVAKALVTGAGNNKLGDPRLVTVKELFDQAEVDEHDNLRFVKVEPAGGTPLKATMELNQELIAAWAERNPGLMFSLTFSDGEATDGNPVPVAREIHQIRNRSGSVMMGVVHVTDAFDQTDYPPARFVASENQLHADDVVGREVFAMATEVREFMRREADARGIALKPGARLMTAYGNEIDVMNMLAIGTGAANAAAKGGKALDVSAAKQPATRELKKAKKAGAEPAVAAEGGAGAADPVADPADADAKQAVAPAAAAPKEGN